MINRRIRCRFCWTYHEVDVGSFLGHVICPDAGEPTYHGQQQLRCYQCGGPPLAGHKGPHGKPACKVHRIERPDDELMPFEHPLRDEDLLHSPSAKGDGS